LSDVDGKYDYELHAKKAQYDLEKICWFIS
jgi:hypothetical protein